MKIFTNSLLAAALLFFGVSSFAQDGIYDTRFVMKDTNCTDGYYTVVIETKAMDAASTFNLSDQNYRFSFNKQAVRVYDILEPEDARSVQIDQQILAGIQTDHTGGISLFNDHTLTGTIDSVVSYNVVLAGGTGFRLKFDEWTPIGCLKFEILDGTICPEFKWHDHNPANFPPTFIGEIVGGVLMEADENSYGNFDICLGPPCPDVFLPVELVEFAGEENNNCHIDLRWKTVSETNNAYFLVERSFDGLDFRPISKEIQGFGEGSTDQEQYYNFVDENIGRANYYRLAQVDIDGSTTYSDVLTIKSNCYTSLVGISELFPVPATEINHELNIKLVADINAENTRMVVTDVLGKKVDDYEINLTTGPNLLTYDTKGLVSGTYFLQVVGDDWFSAPKKFVKLK